jgi:hypothetical protein
LKQASPEEEAFFVDRDSFTRLSETAFSRHFSQGIDLMAVGGAKHMGSAINRLEIGLAIGSASARRGSSQIEVGFEA